MHIHSSPFGTLLMHVHVHHVCKDGATLPRSLVPARIAICNNPLKPMCSLLFLVSQVFDKLEVRLDLGRIFVPCFMVVDHVDLLVIIQHQCGDTVNEVWHAW